MTKIETFALAFALSLSLAACGGAANTNSAAATAAAGAESVDGSMGAESSDTGNETAGTVAGGAGIGTGNAADLATLMTEEPADAHAAAELYQALMHLPQRMHSAWFGDFRMSTSISQAFAHFPQEIHALASTFIRRSDTLLNNA